MTQRLKGIKISNHVFQKHLEKGTNNSAFFNEDVMMKCILECLQKPDKIKYVSNKLELKKAMPFNIGILGFNKCQTRNVKVVCNLKKTFIITAFPTSRNN